jgi:hypothetical protein
MFEDDDYCVRAKNAGFELAITEDCFIYHKGSMSFKKLETEKYIAIFNKNRHYFFDKHNILWKYADIANNIFNRIYLDLNSFQVNSKISDLERVINRLGTLKKALLHLREEEEKACFIHDNSLIGNKIKYINDKINELFNWVEEMSASTRTVQDWAGKLSEENTILRQEIDSLRAQIPSKSN